MWETLRNKTGLKPEQLQWEFNSLFSELISFAIYLGIPVEEESTAQPFWSQDSILALLEDRQLSVPLVKNVILLQRRGGADWNPSAKT